MGDKDDFRRRGPGANRPEWWEDAWKRHEAGATQASIAKALGKQESTVRMALKAERERRRRMDEADTLTGRAARPQGGGRPGPTNAGAEYAEARATRYHEDRPRKDTPWAEPERNPSTPRDKVMEALRRQTGHNGETDAAGSPFEAGPPGTPLDPPGPPEGIPPPLTRRHRNAVADGGSDAVEIRGEALVIVAGEKGDFPKGILKKLKISGPQFEGVKAEAKDRMIEAAAQQFGAEVVSRTLAEGRVQSTANEVVEAEKRRLEAEKKRADAVEYMAVADALRAKAQIRSLKVILRGLSSKDIRIASTMAVEFQKIDAVRAKNPTPIAGPKVAPSLVLERIRERLEKHARTAGAVEGGEE